VLIDNITIYVGFYRDSLTNQLQLLITGTSACGSSNNKQSAIQYSMPIIRADNTIVFESEPLDAAPDIWYESSKTFGLVTSDDICDVSVLNVTYQY